MAPFQINSKKIVVKPSDVPKARFEGESLVERDEFYGV